MTYPKDIKEKIESDFGNKATEVYKIIENAISKTDYINHHRIIRCIVFLANKDVESLRKNIERAAYDPRDVMLLAEYTNVEKDPKRVRDFNKTFAESEKDVRE
jgi:hypothetical protein